MKVVVLGSGAWGTALAMVLCENGHDVTLWSHRAGKAAELAQSRQNPQLKGVTLPASMSFSGDIACVQGADMVVCATASYAVRDTAKAMAPYVTAETVVVSVTKGIERGSHLRMTQVIASETAATACQVVALSGPSHAEEVSRKLPTGCVSASDNAKAAELVQDAFMNSYFRIYTSDDPVGVELGGAIKNVMALSCGVCDGMGFGDNTKALLMTRAITEISRLVLAMGGQEATLAGLAGVGDLIVTCTSGHSRNRQAGILIGQGKSTQEAMDAVGAVVEGYYAAQSVMELAEEFGVEMPISQCAYQVLCHGRDVHDVIDELMTRSKKGE
ncbi:NAD(P)H-dependent glycerol-3-phosphate dehydrogenase [Bengtsoniella intestinalis]|uniref:NAD(P)H-dependent glycerol-3-phosphate dehydrogenase n=1 Tax=Bengtsoniella intestinalis TaxID=3073143 RepID=UPI00391F89DF